MLRSSTALAVAFLLAACGSDSTTTNTTTTPISCTSYCASMATTCVEGDVQFTGLNGTCDSYCGTSNSWPDGVTGATSGNTGACRVTHVALAAAATDAATKSLHCGHAGPSGGNTCGTWCENYCFLALRNCTGANGAGLGFTDNASCLTACAAFPTDGIVGGTVAPHGDNVQCRIYHAGAASAGASGPVPHCGHAQVISASAIGGTTANGPCRPGA